MIKEHKPEAVVIKYTCDYTPEYKSKGASGFDLASASSLWIHPRKTVIVPTGLIVELPEGLELQVRARSGFTVKRDIIVKNGIGTIDSDYRGEIGVILYNIGKRSVYIEKGERIAQGVIVPVIRGIFEHVKKVKTTQRGTQGYGSTGHK